jgi:hypothetical protein
MYQVWDGDLFLFYCSVTEVELYIDDGFSVISEPEI